MQVQQKLDQRPLQPRAPVRVKQKSAAGQFRGAREIHQLEDSHNFDVRLGLEIEVRLRARTRTSGLSSAVLPIVTDSCGKLGNCSISASRAASAFRRLLVQFGDPVAQFARLRFLRLGLGGFLLRHQRADLLGNAIARGLEFFDFGQAFAAVLVELEHLVNFRLVPALRVARRWRTKSVFSRINLISSIAAIKKRAWFGQADWVQLSPL